MKITSDMPKVKLKCFTTSIHPYRSDRHCGSNLSRHCRTPNERNTQHGIHMRNL
ncbi:hypothetical protein K439DRAFT_1634115 [Ramaria rubella]|nr:hypothetical protein K439DRAFT_1635450 [Ramaria rubella]KAF8583795.1 hypothetical protein K439DRAFT_1634115 [Ramaria rubella]